jgi:hypothetical protein
MAYQKQDPPVAWTVIGTNPQIGFGPGNQPAQGHMVTFTTSAGNRGQVFVPDNVSGLDAARDIIAKQAAYVDGLAGLSG